MSPVWRPNGFHFFYFSTFLGFCDPMFFLPKLKTKTILVNIVSREGGGGNEMIIAE